MSASRLRNQVLSIVLLASVLPGVAEVRGSGDYWVSRASAPMSVFLSGATTVGGRVYVMGGLYSLTSSNGRNGQNSPSNVAYDPNSDVWTVLAPMTTVRQQMGVVAVNGKIYAIGRSGYDSPT